MSDSVDKLQFCKVRKVKSPVRAHQFDAGIDFFVPEDLTNAEMQKKFDVTGDHLATVSDENDIIKEFTLGPGQSVLIPSGIKVRVPDGYMLQYHNKSGIASKRHLLVGANTVDIGYEGECHINLHNVSTRPQVIAAGDKIVQGILIPVSFAVPEEVENEDTLYPSRSERGEGGFGSTSTR